MRKSAKEVFVTVGLPDEARFKAAFPGQPAGWEADLRSMYTDIGIALRGRATHVEIFGEPDLDVWASHYGGGDVDKVFHAISLAHAGLKGNGYKVSPQYFFHPSLLWMWAF